ncbi:hypothetical protein BC830DRAFT_473569 [Chytriomyces sp. MP71]|nr:hypothetical protein BC830DRAFT_473569 [Chytriomyces sp. MP71]
MIYSFLSSRTMSGTCCLPPWTWKRLRDETKRMPSRPQYPFIGSLPSFKDFLSQNRINAYFFKCHQDLGPIVEHNLFGNRNISVADPVEAKKILTGSAFVRHDFLIANSPDLLEFGKYSMKIGHFHS